MNILGKRYYFFLFSLLLIVPGLIVLAINGMPLSIDFIGGTALEVQFATGNVPDTAQVKAIYDNLGITDAQIQTTSDNTLFIRSSALSSEINNEVMAKLREASGSDVTILRSDTGSHHLYCLCFSWAATRLTIWRMRNYRNVT